MHISMGVASFHTVRSCADVKNDEEELCFYKGIESREEPNSGDC